MTNLIFKATHPDTGYTFEVYDFDSDDEMEVTISAAEPHTGSKTTWLTVDQAGELHKQLAALLGDF